MKNKGIVLFVLLAIIGMAGCGKKSFDVCKNVKVNFEGYDGYGICTLEDKYAWIDDVMDWYGDSITDQQRRNSKSELRETVTYEVTPDSNLSNGDTVTVTVNIDSAADDYAFKLKSKDITVTVNGLEEVDEFDPFENVSVTFEGTAPKGRAVINVEHSDRTILYELDKIGELSNGDVVTLVASPRGDMNSYANEYGKVFSCTEKTYIVDGLSYYADSVDDIAPDMKDKMLRQAEDSIKASFAKITAAELKEAEFMGYYLLRMKDSFTNSINYMHSTGGNNEIYCVYKITSSITGLKRGSDGTALETAEEEYYTYFKYSNILNLPDGTCSVDLSRGELSSRRIESNYGYKVFWGAEFYSYPGYWDLDSMFNDVVVAKLDKYDYENTVK